MGGYYEVYTSLEERSEFTYANLRKASYTGSVRRRKCSHNSAYQHYVSVFKFWTIGGIFLYMFSDALLFDMMLNTAFQDGIDTIQDLIDKDMSLGIEIMKYNVN